MSYGAKDGVKDIVKVAPDILGKETQHKIAVFLQQGILAPVAAIGVNIG